MGGDGKGGVCSGGQGGGHWGDGEGIGAEGGAEQGRECGGSGAYGSTEQGWGRIIQTRV